MSGQKILNTSELNLNPPIDVVAGASGSVIYNGYLVEDEKDSRVSGSEKYVTYSNNLANTPIVATGVRFFLHLITKAGWKVEPANDSAEAMELADKVLHVMNDMRTPWYRVVRRAAMSRFYGFSIQEWTAKQNDRGFVGFVDIAPRPQRTIKRWDVDDDGYVVGVIQRDPQTQKEIYLPRTKIVYIVDDTINDSPEGLGLFRHTVDAVHRLKRYEILEGWSFERDLRGTPVGRAPLSAIQKAVETSRITKQEADDLLSPIKSFIQKALAGKDTGMLLESAVFTGGGESRTPSATPQWGIELLKGDPKGQTEVAAAIERVNRDIARALGVEHLLLGSTDRGSFAMSKDKSQTFGLVVDSTLTEIRETFQHDVIDTLWVLNGWPDELKPIFKTEAIAYRDIEQVTQALKDLSQAGAPVMPNDPAVNEIRTQLGLSDAPEIDEDLVLQSMYPDPSAGQDNGQDPAATDPEEDPTGTDQASMEKVLMSPRKGETRADFVSRFMSSEKAKTEFPDRDQRLAVAYSQFKRGKK